MFDYDDEYMDYLRDKEESVKTTKETAKAENKAEEIPKEQLNPIKTAKEKMEYELMLLGTGYRRG